MVHIRDCNTQPVWRAVCINRGPKKLPPIPTATTSFSTFLVAPTCQNFPVTKTSLILALYYPRTTADSLREVLDLVQNTLDLGDHILSITLYNCIPWSTKSYMKHWPILCAIYLKAPTKWWKTNHINFLEKGRI